MSNVRVTYSGLISFIIGIITIFTGLVFILIVTRTFSANEFGSWSLIGTMIGYFLISERVVSYWTTRQIARDEKVGSTSLISSSSFSIAAVPLYLIAVFLLSQQNDAPLEPMLIGAILIPVFFVSESLHSINLGHMPQATSYALLGFEIIKIPAALSFVYFLELGIIGAIFALLAAYLVRIGIQLYFARSKIKVKFSVSFLKRWFKLSWLPLYSNITKFLKSSDIVVYSLITGSVTGIAYYSAAMTLDKIIHHTDSISKALYPKLIATGDSSYIQENLTLQMYFAIPLLGIAVLFAKPAMFALNPIYLDVAVIAMLLAFRMFFAELNGAFGKILQGIDKVDVEQNPKFSSLIKSKIFLVLTIKNILTGIQLGIVITVLVTLHSLGLSELELVTGWVIASLFIEIPFVLFMWLYVRKHVTSAIFHLTKVGKYVVATFAFVAVFFITSDTLIEYKISIYDFLPGVIFQLIICVGIYLVITYLIDKKTRSLFKSIIREITTKK